MEFIDSHAHINSSHFKENWQNIINEAHQVGVSTIINNASNLTNTEWGIEQSRQEESLFTTAGIHPEFFLETNQLVAEQDYNNLRRLISSTTKVVAIGEIGLDYTLDLERASKSKQYRLLETQLQLALELQLPVTLHVRDQPGHAECFNDLVAILQQFTTSPQAISGVFHCWVGTPAQADRALSLGFFLSFSGILTYKSAGHILDVASSTPIDKILIETDAPYLTPEPARSQKKPPFNHPQYVIMTAEKLAAIRNLPISEIAANTSSNARRLFKLNQ